MEYIQLTAGLVLLIISGDFLVKGGVSLARHLKISTLVVGLTVVAFGTSAPELIVSFNSALKSHPEIAVGNVVGSNIANIALVLALTAAVMPMNVRFIPMSMASIPPIPAWSPMPVVWSALPLKRC